jgi:hypothetical protein
MLCVFLPSTAAVLGLSACGTIARAGFAVGQLGAKNDAVSAALAFTDPPGASDIVGTESYDLVAGCSADDG